MIAKDSIKNRATNVAAQDEKGMKSENNRFWLKVSLLSVMISSPALASKHHASTKSSSHSSSHAATLHQKKSAAFHTSSSHFSSSSKTASSKTGHFFLAQHQGGRYGSHYAMSRNASVMPLLIEVSIMASSQFRLTRRLRW